MQSADFLATCGGRSARFSSEVSHRFQESLQRYLLVHDPPRCTWLKLTFCLFLLSAWFRY